MASRDLALQLLIIAKDLATPELDSATTSTKKLNEAIDALINPFDRLSESSANFGESVKRITQPLADIATKSLAAGAAFGVLGTALGSVAYEESKRLETAQVSLAKVLDDNEGNVEKFTDEMRKLGLQYGENSQSLLAAQAEFKQAGFTAEDSAKLVKNALDLMISGDVSAAESSQYLVSILKGFGEESSQAARLLDVLNEVSNKYATNVKELAIGMGDLAPIAKLMNFSFEETAALLTPVIEVFGSGSEAADALKTGLLKLQDTSKPVQDALNSIGVSQTNLSGTLRSGKEIFLDVAKAFQTIDQEQKLFITSQLVGIDQSARMVKVFDDLGKYSEIVGVGMKSAGSATKEVELRLKTAQVEGNKTAEAFRQVAEIIGTKYRDSVKNVIVETGNLAKAFATATEAGSLDKLIDAVKPQLKAVEDLFREVAKNIPEAFAQIDWSRLVKAISGLSTELGEVFSNLTANIDLTSVDGLRQALQLAADGLAMFTEYLAGVVDQMQPVFAAFGQFAKILIENSEGTAEFAGEVVGLSFTLNKLVPIVTSTISKMFSFLGILSEVTLAVGALYGGIKLLNLAGISVLPTLGKMATAMGGLSVSTAATLSVIAGAPGLIAGLSAAAGVAGYAFGTVLNAALDKTIQKLTGSESLGTLIYDTEQSIRNFLGTSSDLTRELEAQAKAEELLAQKKREALAAEEETRKKAQEAIDKQRAANQALLDTQTEQEAINAKLIASFETLGKKWNENTGAILDFNDKLSQSSQLSSSAKTAIEALGLDAGVVFNELTDKNQKLLNGLIALSQEADISGNVLSAAFSKGIDAAETITELDLIRSLLQKMGEDGKLSAEQIALAMIDVNQKTAELYASIDPLTKALDQFGIDSTEAFTGLDAEMQASIQTLDVLANSARITGDVLYKAITESIDAANTVKELETLKAKVEEFGRSGELSGNQVKQAIAELNVKLQDANKEIDPLAKAFENLGITSAKELKAIADQAQVSFDLIRNSSTATTAEIEQAFVAMADKQLQAAQAQSREALLATQLRLTAIAETGKYGDALNEIIKKYSEIEDKAKSAGATQTDSIDKTTQALAAQQQQLVALEQSMVGIQVATIKVGNQMAVAFDTQGIRQFNGLAQEVNIWLEQANAAIAGLNTGDWLAVSNAQSLANSLGDVSGYMDDTVKTVRDDLVSAIQDATDRMREFANIQKDALQKAREDLEDMRAANDEFAQEQLRHKRELAELDEALAIAQQQRNQEAIDAIMAQMSVENEKHKLIMNNLELEKQQAEFQRTQDARKTRDDIEEVNRRRS